MRRTLYYTGYAAWQRAAYRAALDLHRDRPFDLAHQLNITGYREPGYLWKLPIPFVWGPVGGAADIPPGFFPIMSARRPSLLPHAELGQFRAEAVRPALPPGSGEGVANLGHRRREPADGLRTMAR